MKRLNFKYVKPLFRIAVPIMLSNVISQIQMIVDKAFLGHVDKLYMSALSNVTTPMWTTMSFCFSLVCGASIIISQKVGAGDKEGITEYAAATMKWNNVLPMLLFFFWMFFHEPVFRLMGVSDKLMPMCREYVQFYAPIFLVVGLEASSMVIMQTSNYTKPMIAYGVIRAGLNMLLDWVLIFGKFGLPALGIKGAAIATLIAEYAGVGYSLYIFMTSDKLFTRPGFKEILKAKAAPFMRTVKLGFNAALEDFAWNFGNLMLIKILNSIDEMAAGIYSIIFSVEVLVVCAVGALGQGTMTLSSEAYGRRDSTQYKGVCKTAYVLSATVSAVLLIACLVLPEQIISIFTPEQSIITGCGLYLILMSVNLFSKSCNIIFGSGIKGSGNTLWMFATQIFGTVFIITIAYVLVNVCGLGILGVFIAVLLDEFTRGVINLGKFIRISRRLPVKG